MLYKGDKKARLYKGDAHPAEWYKGGDKITGFTTESKSGEHIEFSDSYNGKFDELTVYGMSEQQSYAGTNLANIEAYNKGWNSQPYPFMGTSNGWIALSLVDTSVNKTFSIKFTCINHAFGTVARYMDADGKFIQSVFLGAGNEVDQNKTHSVTFTVTDACKILAINLFNNRDATLVDESNIADLQLNVGNTLLHYEPYVGGKPAPNMDFPQPIVDLNAETKVRGRNLFDGVYIHGYIDTNDGETYPTSDRDARVSTQNFIEITPPYSYFCPASSNLSKGRAYDRDKRYITSFAMPFRAEEYTIKTLPTGTKYIKFEVDCANVTAARQLVEGELGRTYINAGNTVNYEPYREPQEIAITARGIPVPRNGNYTDANGQQWYCDTVDLARGKYIQRVKRTTLTLTKAQSTTKYGYRWTNQNVRDAAIVANETGDNILCTTLLYNDGAGTSASAYHDGIRMSGSYKTIVAEFGDDEHDSVDVEVAYMINPIETDLDAFTTLFPTTVIDSNTDRVTATAKVVDGGTT